MKPASGLKLALFGDPVDHSLSPRIHAVFARAHGLVLDYRLIASGVHDLPDRFAAFIADGGGGANFTVPVKAAAAGLAQGLTPAALQAGAINTLYRHQHRWIGDNTDGPGLVADLRRLDLGPERARILIIGAGGAVTGIVGPLLAAGAARIAIHNRTPEPAAALIRRFDDARLTQAPAIEGGWDRVIQATSLGHRGETPDLSGLAPGTRIYDLNYGPAHTPLARHCRELGLSCHDGLGMLVEQARSAFEGFTGERVGDATCREVLETLRCEMQMPR